MGSPTQNLHGQLTQKRPPASINSFYIFLSKPHHSWKMSHLWQALILVGTLREREFTHRRGGQRTVDVALSKAPVDTPAFNSTVNKEVIRTASTPLAIWYLIMQQACQQTCWMGFKISYMAQWSHNPHYTRPGTSLLEFTSALLCVSLTVFSLGRTYWSHSNLQYICLKEFLPLQLVLGGSFTTRAACCLPSIYQYLSSRKISLLAVLCSVLCGRSGNRETA